MIMSKKDLCDYNETKKWINYYEEKGYIVLCMNIEKEFNKKLLPGVEHVIANFAL